MTHNPADYHKLHKESTAHKGIIAVFGGTDGLSSAQIAKAVVNLRESTLPIEGEFHVANDWAYDSAQVNTGPEA